MIKNLLSALGNTSVNRQMTKREFLYLVAGGLVLGGCAKKEVEPAQKEPEIPPIVTEQESELEQIANTNVYHTYGEMVEYDIFYEYKVLHDNNILQGKILHIIGGTSSKTFADHKKTSIDVHEVFMPEIKKWITLKQRMPKPRWDTTAYVHDNKIYVVGGEGPEGSYNNTVFTFDWQNGWQTLEGRFPFGIRHAAAVIVDETPYIAGGFIRLGDGREQGNPFIFKQIAPDKWEKVAEIPEPGRYGSVAGIDGKIYLLGGFFGPDSGPDKVVPHPIQIYNTRDPSWTTGKMPGRLISHLNFNRNGKIMVYGYMDLLKDGKRQSVNPGIFEYSPQDDTWAYVKSIKHLNLSGETYGNLGDQLFHTGCELYRYNTGLVFSGKINDAQRQQIS